MKSFIGACFIALLLTTTFAQAVEKPEEKAKPVPEISVVAEVPALVENTTQPAPATPTLSNEVISSSDSVTLKNELLVLRTQNELIKSYQDDLIYAVYWSLGAVVTIAVLLVGYGGWSNYRLHEKDKVRLKEEVVTMISEMESRVTVQLADNHTEFRNLLDSRLESVINRLTADINKVGSELSDTDDSLEAITKNLANFITMSKDALLMTDKKRSQLEALFTQAQSS